MSSSPVAYRGPFGQLLTLMMAGLFSSAIVQYGINPIFQIAKRTAPLIAAAVIACLVDVVLIMVLPKNPDASSFAVAQTGAYIAGLGALVIMATFTKPQWPRLRDLVLATVATAAMAAALLPLREHNPGLLTLVEQVIAGALVYCFFVYVFDIANLREITIARLRPILARLQASS
ncbi:MAG: polysaccharide biosynthesis C-terminal domain-containing protein [Methylovirgula sp.]